MIGGPAGVSIMLGDFEIGAVISQAIEHIGGLMRRGRDHVDMVGGALIGDMRVEAEAVVDAVARVDVTARGTALGSPAELTIGAGLGAVGTDPREWQAMLGRSEEHTSEIPSLMRISKA